MAVSVKDLIAQKEVLENRKKEQYDINTGIGVVTVSQPSRALVLESLKLEGEGESDKYLVYNTVTEPSLKNQELQTAFGCLEPTDIVEKLFKPGEVNALAKAILKTAGYNEDYSAAVHEAVKN